MPHVLLQRVEDGYPESQEGLKLLYSLYISAEKFFTPESQEGLKPFTAGGAPAETPAARISRRVETSYLYRIDIAREVQPNQNLKKG